MKTALGVLLAIVSCELTEKPPKTASVQAQPAPLPQPAATRSAAAPSTRPSFSELVESVKGAVVNVDVRQTRSSNVIDMEELLLGRRRPDVRGAGSGFIIGKEGLVLTNSHVVRNATAIRVKLEDQREFDARVLGTDPLTDLALLQLQGELKDLPVLTLGDSDTLKVGDWVVAIGNPFGLASSVSAGIVSAKARNIGAGPYDDFLQTDAAINPGNSGGPLFNLDGEVVGINTAIVGGGSGIGFAVPSSFAKAILPQLKQGEVQRGWLGVSIQDLTPQLAKALKVPDDLHGAVVSDVQRGTPGADAGLKAEDVVVGVNGQPVMSAMELSRAVGFMRPGDTAALTVWRSGKQRQVDVKLGKRPDLEGVSQRPAQQEESAKKLGLSYEDASARMRGVTGALVTAVEPGSAAEQAQLQPGMVIVEADGQPVRSAQDLTRILAKHRPGDVALLRIRIQDGKILRALPISSFTPVPPQPLG